MKHSNETLPQTLEGWVRHYASDGIPPARARYLAKIHAEIASLAERAFAKPQRTLNVAEIYAQRRRAVAPPGQSPAEIYAARRRQARR
jgi:hypothetical protein